MNVPDRSLEPGTRSRHREGRRRALSLALAAAIVLGTLAGVVATSALALVLASSRLLATGLEPRPEGAALRWLVSPAVARPASEALLWLLGGATLLLATLVAAGARRAWLWRAYAGWAVVGGILTTYALVANWQLAREAGFVAFAIGAFWSAVVALGIARTRPWERHRGRTAG